MNRKVYIVTKKKKNRKKKLFLFLFMPVLLVLLAGAGYASTLYFKAQNIANESFESLDGNSKQVAELSNSVDNMSVLFIGVDDSESRNFQDSTRSDALMVATFNKKDNSIKLLSIPRDSYVYVPEEDEYTKINHAYAAGGAKSTVETVENLLDIEIDHYVRMNFYAFIDIVDALDGIQVDVPYEISEKDSNDMNDSIVIEEGLQTLDGEEALAFARTRKKDNDMERGKRQQELMQAIVEKTASVSSLSKYTDVMEAIGGNMKTDFTFSQMKALVAYMIQNRDIAIETLQLAGEDAYINDVYYYELDEEALEETSESMQAHLSGLPNSQADQNDVADNSVTHRAAESKESEEY